MRARTPLGARASLALILVGCAGLSAGCSDEPTAERATGEAGPDNAEPVSATAPSPTTTFATVTSTTRASAPTTSSSTTTTSTTPPTVPPTVPPPPMPDESSLGPPPSVRLHELDAAKVRPGARYARVRVAGSLNLGPGLPPTRFTSCHIEGTIVTYSPVHLDACTVTGGVYAYDTGGTITNSLLEGSGQAFRPGTTNMADALTTPTPWTVKDTIIRIGPGVPPAHVEASQVLGGVGITFRNVVFESGGPFNNTQTADLNFIGRGLLCEDCWFIGYGGYAIYSTGPGNVFIRPRFARNSAFGLLFPSEPGMEPVIIDPYYTDGTPISLQE